MYMICIPYHVYNVGARNGLGDGGGGRWRWRWRWR